MFLKLWKFPEGQIFYTCLKFTTRQQYIKTLSTPILKMNFEEKEEKNLSLKSGGKSMAIASAC